MAYVLLLLAIVTEVVGTSQIKGTRGLTHPAPVAIGITSYAAAFALLSLAVHRGMQVSVGYALWSGLGTTLIVAAGVLFLHEPVTAGKLAGIALVVAGVIVLNAAGAG